MSKAKLSKTFGGVVQYLINKEARSKYTYRIDEHGLCYYIVGDEKISERDFARLHPLYIDNGRTRLDRRQY